MMMKLTRRGGDNLAICDGAAVDTVLDGGCGSGGMVAQVTGGAEWWQVRHIIVVHACRRFLAQIFVAQQFSSAKSRSLTLFLRSRVH